MLTLKQAIKDQENLDELCRDIGLPRKKGWVCSLNDFYGNEEVLNAYAGLPKDYVVKCLIPHGVMTRDDLLQEWVTRRAFVPTVLCYPPHLHNLYTARTNKKVVLSAAPAIYAIRLAEREKPAPKRAREGMIFFPSHSTHHNQVIDEYDLIAEKLSNLDSRYQPVTVCIYWKDYLQGRHIPFKKRGMSIVSAGYLCGNPEFLFRLYHLCSLHKYSCSNSFGTAVFFSIMCGCDFIPMNDTRPRYIINDIEHVESNFVLAGEYFYALCHAYPNGNRGEFTRAAEYFLGKPYEVSPVKLREILMEAERRFRYSCKDTRKVQTVHVPYKVLQKIRSIKGRVKEILLPSKS